MILIAAGLAAGASGLSAAAANLILSSDGLTVYDAVNNITWLADANTPAANRFGLPVCNGTNPGIRTCVNASGSMNYGAAAAWVAAMNAANYLGRSDWQLPTTPTVDKTCPKVGPTGDSFGFGCTLGALDSLYNALGLKPPNTAVPISGNTAGPFRNLQPYLYWSRTSAGTGQGNTTFSFATGWQGANTLPNLLYAWPMIAGKIAGIPAGTGNGLEVSADQQTVYDPMTGITWLANANLAASNTFGLPRCTDPVTPPTCVAQDGAMTYDSATQFIDAMNAAAYLGQKNWQLPSIDPSCPGYGCDGSLNPLGNLFYDQLGFIAGSSAVAVPNIAVGPVHNLQPYLYWTCGGPTIQSACSPDGPAPNFEWSYSFGSGFLGTDLVANSLYVTAYFAGTRPSTNGPTISYVANAEGESPAIAPNTWVEIKGANLAPAGDSRIWRDADFSGSQMPTQLDHVGVMVNGKSAYIYYISPSQIDILTPPDAMSGPVQVVVNNNGAASGGFTAQSQAASPSWFVFNGGPYVAAVHASGGLIGPASLYPGSTTPAKPGEIILLYANGFGSTNTPVVSGSLNQGGALSPLPAVTIGGKTATVQFAGLVGPGQFQFNVVVPPNTPDGDQPVSAAFNGLNTQPGTLLTVQH
jgi:uncharacterized protein (TIGR03437 family)